MTTTLHCKVCGKIKEVQYFSPFQRVDDGNPKVCWDCEIKEYHRHCYCQELMEEKWHDGGEYIYKKCPQGHELRMPKSDNEGKGTNFYTKIRDAGLIEN